MVQGFRKKKMGQLLWHLGIKVNGRILMITLLPFPSGRAYISNYIAGIYSGLQHADAEDFAARAQFSSEEVEELAMFRSVLLDS